MPEVIVVTFNEVLPTTEILFAKLPLPDTIKSSNPMASRVTLPETTRFPEINTSLVTFIVTAFTLEAFNVVIEAPLILAVEIYPLPVTTILLAILSVLPDPVTFITAAELITGPSVRLLATAIRFCVATNHC